MDGSLALDRRARLLRLEAEIAALPQVDLALRHFFAPGVYAREMTIPAGVVLTGKIHKFAHVNIISQGDISVYTEQGIKRIRAPYTMVSPPGTKRGGYAHETTVWTMIHPTDETDLEKIEAHFIARDYDEYLAHVARLAIAEG